MPVGGWLAWEIHRTIGLGHIPALLGVANGPSESFDLAMLDFALTSGWAYLVLHRTVTAAETGELWARDRR